MLTIKDAFKMGELAVEAIEIIHGLAAVGDTGAIAKLVSGLRDGFQGKTTPEIVQRDLETFRQMFSQLPATNDAIIDQEAREKFGDDK